jgi:hypothetical protein
MMKKMKMMKRKISLFLLFTVIFGAANVCAQVRIGGNQIPHPAAVLDLNASDATINGKLGLSLPRVSLADPPETTLENGVTPKDGTLVYNTNAGFSGGVGLYYWYGTRWIKLDTQSVYSGGPVEVDSVVGNEVVGPTGEGGLMRFGSGTKADPYTLAIATRGVTAGKLDLNSVTTNRITYKAVTYEKLDDANASSGQVLKHDGSGWAPAADEQGLTSASNGLTVSGSGVKLGGFLSEKTTITTPPNAPLVVDGPGGFYYGGPGKVGIRMQPTATSATFEVYGAIANDAPISASGQTIDFSESNLAYTTASAGAFTLSNLKSGATYTLAVQGTTSGTSTFTATNTAGAPLTVKILNNAATVSGKHTLYTIIVMDTTAYISVASGF